MILETKRLILRNFIRSDIEKYAAIRDSESHRFCDEEDLSPESSRRQAELFIDRAGSGNRSHYQMAILDRRDGALLGSCGIQLTPGSGRSGSFECELAQQYRGQGYGFEAAEALIDLAFTQLGLSYVIAEAVSDNKEALNLAYRLGMKPEKSFRDSRQFRGRSWDTTLLSLSREDWARPPS